MKEVERILNRTSGGRDVFEKYFGEITGNKLFRNIYRQDSNASCILKYNSRGQRFIMKDYGDSSWYGDCFTIVGKIIGKNTTTEFMDILIYIDADMNLGCLDGTFDSSKINRPTVTPDEFARKNPLEFKAVYRNFTNYELEYWNTYGITLPTLRRYNVRSIEKCKFVKSVEKEYTVYSTKKQPAFGYFFSDNKGIKLYRPKSENRFLYAGELPNPYMFGYEQLPENGELIIITGGEKDVMSLAAHGFNAICFNSETAFIRNNIFTELSKRFEKVVIMYDSDATGVKESANRIKDASSFGLENVTSLTLPLAGTKEEKDVSDYFRLGNTRESLVELLKNA